MKPAFKSDLKTKNSVLIRDLIFFLLCYLNIYLWIRPELIYQRQEPIFFFDHDFFLSFLRYPGGLTDYVAAFFAQFLVYPWLGGLIIILFVGLICLLTRVVIEAIHQGYGSTTAYLIPAALLLALHSQYRYSLSSTIGLFIALLIFRLFIYFGKRYSSTRAIFYFIAGIIVYYLTAGYFLLFALLCIVFEILNESRRWLERLLFSIFYVAVALLMPLFAASQLFLVDLTDAYLGTLPFGIDFKFKIAAYLLLLFFPMILIVAYLWKRFRSDLQGNSQFYRVIKFSTSFQSKTKLFIQTVVLMIVTLLLAFLSFDKNNKMLFQLDFYARHERWEDILNTFRKYPLQHEIVSYQVNRALYHTGQLSNEMFAYPQIFGVNGLILTTEASYSARLQTSDLLFELGHVNAALRWAHEAMSMRGETPWNLMRIAQINLLKQCKAYTQICLKRLNKTLLFRGWAKRYQWDLDNNAISDVKLQHIQSLMPKSDFIIAPDSPTADLKNLLINNSKNKMAFEYLMAYYLLARQLGDLADNLSRLRDLDYPAIPRHYQEALLLYMLKTKKHDMELYGYKISPEVMKRFNDFNLTLTKYQGDKERARKELMNKHGNTYWYYVLYSKYIVPKSLKDKFDAITGATKNE